MILHKVLLLKIDYNFIPTDYEVILNHYIKILKYFSVDVVPRHISIKAYEILKKWQRDITMKVRCKQVLGKSANLVHYSRTKV